MAVLYLIAAAAPPAADVPQVIPLLLAGGWDVWVIPTPQAGSFIDPAAVEAATGHPIRSDFRAPGQERLPLPDAVLAAPLTFNTVNRELSD